MGNKMVVDTETANTPKIDGKLFSDDGQVYDACFRVINDAGETLEVVPVINRDVFISMPEAMNEAYFAAKIPQYWRDIWDKKYTVTDSWGMFQIFRDLCRKWNIEAIIAHNAPFDIRVLNSTMRYQTKSKKRYFLPYGMPVIDTMRMAQATICKSPDYVEFCKQNGLMTKHSTPRPRATAEAIWQFLTRNLDFAEEHTGVGDTEIEAQIYAACLRWNG